MRNHEQTKLYPDLYTTENNWVDPKVVQGKNRYKKWEYGYNSEYDIVVISKDGTIGDIYNINGLRIALPKTPKNIPKRDDKWVPHEIPKALKRIPSTKEWKKYPKEFREEHAPYINQEFDRREFGHWFMNNGIPTYMTGHNYMYLQHTKIDVGKPDYREANRIYFIFWEACKADNRCFGMIYLKIRRSGFSFMAASTAVDIATLSKESRIGVMSKTGGDAKKLFTDKIVPMSNNYPFFFKPIQSGMDKPKTALEYSVPATRITKNNIHTLTEDADEGLNTSIDWKNTGDNSYDGEKLKFLIEDEAAKVEKPDSIKEGWRVRQTCLRVGKKIIGKVQMGSTCNALAKGGQNFKDLYDDSDPSERSKNGRTKSGMYRLFIPFEWNAEGFIDEYGMPVFTTPEKPVMGIDGEWIDQGAIDFWENEVASRKHDPDDLNEYYRQNPRTESHAFRDESKASIFNLTKIYQQIDYNDSIPMINQRVLTQGSFSWKDGVKDSTVLWTPNPRGRFLVSWLPPSNMQNRVITRGDKKYPGNEMFGVFGCDTYDISGTVFGGGSKGALHGLTKYSMDDNVPSSQFFLEYIARPSTAEEFFEDVLMAIVFYGMPILVENNKPRLLYHLKHRGYRGFSLNRPDKHHSKLSKSEKELGGIPNTSEDVRQIHADAIATYIEQHVGLDEMGHYRDPEEMGNMLFNKTLNDWARFEYNNRTVYDASISSGLALMAAMKHKLTPTKEKSKIKVNFVKYDNTGYQSKISR